MIHYQLRCHDEHHFEAWFKDSAAYDAQAAVGDIECPYCGSTRIGKAPMAPRVATTKSAGPETRAQDVAERILEAVHQAKRYAEQNFDNVGDQFANEARKIHYGEADERGIYGSATEDEARELDEEGIDYLRLPDGSRKNN